MMIQKTIAKLPIFALVLLVILSGCADKAVQICTANVTLLSLIPVQN